MFPFYLERAQGACKEKQPASCSVLATKRVSLGRYRCQRGCDTEARWSWCSQRRSRSMNNFCRTRHEESYLSGIILESSNFLAKKNPPTLALELQTTHHHDSYTKAAIDWYGRNRGVPPLFLRSCNFGSSAYGKQRPLQQLLRFSVKEILADQRADCVKRWTLQCRRVLSLTSTGQF